MPQQQLVKIKQNQYVANLLSVADQEVLVSQLRQIRDALSCGGDVEVMPYLKAGKRVLVTGGAFKGLEGLVLRAKGKTRIVINVDMIQQAVAVEVDTSFIAPG